MKFDALPRDFFDPSAEAVAPALLGHWLLRKTPEGLCGGPIVEAEAYLAGDPACHAFIGETARNRAMWGEPGRAYVYLIYGFHCCANAVCRPKGIAEAVLIRAIEPFFGEERMRRRRAAPLRRDLTSGPGKLCAALGIDRTLDGADLADPGSELFIARNPDAEAYRDAHGPVGRTIRIGINKTNPAAGWPLRFLLPKSEFVSKGLAGRRKPAS